MCVPSPLGEEEPDPVAIGRVVGVSVGLVVAALVELPISSARALDRKGVGSGARSTSLVVPLAPTSVYPRR